ncbi:MAG TPA: DUF4394 domain-containing protein [Isosphaeraceae bacterium]
MSRAARPRPEVASPPRHRSRPRSSRPAVEGLEGRTLLSTILALTSNDSLLTFDSAAPASVSGVLAITGVPSGESIVAIDFQPATGQVFGLGSKSHLYTIDLLSGAATAVSTTAFSTALVGGQFAMDDNPVTNLLRIVDDSGQNFRVNPSTGAVAGNDGTLTYAIGDPNVGEAPDIVGLAYTNNVAGATSTTAYAIDATTGTLDLLGSPDGTPSSPDSGQLTTVGSLGVTVANSTGGSFGLDILGATTTAFAILTPTSGTNANKPVLYSINLSTGAATSLGVVADGSLTILGLAASTLNPPPAPTLAAGSDSSGGFHITKINTPTIIGTAIPGATVWILANGNHVGTGTADSSGNYAIATTKLADGPYTVQAIQFDASGVPSGASPAMSPPLVIDTATPPPPSVPHLLPADDTGFSDTDHYTRDNTPAFTGTALPGATVYLFANYVLIGSATATSAGTYLVQSTALPDGTYQIQASQFDVAGNVGNLSNAMSPALVIDTSNRPTPDDAYINALYVSLLGTPVDTAGLATWLNVLEGTGGRQAVVGGLIASTAYRGNVVQTTYQAFLGRAASPTEEYAAILRLATTRIEAFKAQVAGTNEFYALAGGTVAGFLARLGQVVLGQPIDANSLAIYTAQLKSGVSRTTIAYDVLTSTAGYTATVNSIYASLHLTPEPVGVAAAVASLQRGGTDQQVTQALATTNAFFAQAQGNGETIFQWARQAYFDLFGTYAAPSFTAAMANLIEQGIATPLQVVQGLQFMPQYRQVVVTDLYESILGHGPEPAALANASAYLASGGTVENLRAILISSPDFYQIEGGGTTAGALAAMYKDATGKPIPSNVLTALQSQLAAGISFYQITASLLYNPAGVANTIQGLYQIYVRQPATFTDYSAFAAALSGGFVSDQAIVAVLMTTDAYFAGL